MCVIDNLVLLQLSWRTLQVFHYMLWQSVQNREKTMISKAPSGFLLNSSGIYYSLITRYCSWSQYYLYNNQKYTVFANEYFCIIVSAQHCWHRSSKAIVIVNFHAPYSGSMCVENWPPCEGGLPGIWVVQCRVWRSTQWCIGRQRSQPPEQIG